MSKKIAFKNLGRGKKFFHTAASKKMKFLKLESEYEIKNTGKPVNVVCLEIGCLGFIGDDVMVETGGVLTAITDFIKKLK